MDSVIENYVKIEFDLEIVDEDRVICQWLSSEASNPNHKFAKGYEYLFSELDGGLDLVTEPDFDNEDDNLLRNEIFWEVRGQWLLWAPIYEHTCWYKTKINLNRLKIIAPFAKDTAENSDADLNGLILWGHALNEPFILLDGNHRFHARDKSKEYIVEVFIGLSDIAYSLCADNGCEKCIEYFNKTQ